MEYTLFQNRPLPYYHNPLTVYMQHGIYRYNDTRLPKWMTSSYGVMWYRTHGDVIDE
jgi:hypothetical protein